MVSSNNAHLGSSSWGPYFLEEIHIDRVVLAPLFWQVVLVINRLYWADWLTSSAIDALIRVDVEHAIAFIDAVHWAFINAGPIFDVNARKSNYISHLSNQPLSKAFFTILRA
jgi:hypothetical protein